MDHDGGWWWWCFFDRRSNNKQEAKLTPRQPPRALLQFAAAAVFFVVGTCVDNYYIRLSDMFIQQCPCKKPGSLLFVDQGLDIVLVQHAINYIKTFQSEYEKITADVCITCIKRWFSSVLVGGDL